MKRFKIKFYQIHNSDLNEVVGIAYADDNADATECIDNFLSEKNLKLIGAETVDYYIAMVCETVDGNKIVIDACFREIHADYLPSLQANVCNALIRARR